jgi:hypothetical protein
MEVRVGEKLATEQTKKGQKSTAKKIDCGKMLVNVR